jgi:hypothetical protein
MIGRFFGWIFLLAAGAVLVRDGLAWNDTHIFAPETLGGAWFDLSSGSLRLFQGAIERIAPWLWSYGVAPILFVWAAPVFLILGFVLIWQFRKAKRRRFRPARL